jgi:cytochrome b subunit of formate dehydrogenase
MKLIRLMLLMTAALFIMGGGPLRADADTCFQCHDTVDPKKFDTSIHGQAGIGCVDCHTDLQGVTDFPHAEELQPANCAACHEDVVADYGKSLHAQTAALGKGDAPTCASCHGKHDILPASDPQSPTHKVHESKLCSKCHGANGLKDSEVILPQVFESYSQSVHAKRIGQGNLQAASCSDCHGTHILRGAADPESHINRWRIPETCGKCHQEIHDEYMAGIHGKAFKLGISDSPTCTDCHGEHEILGHESKDSPTFNKRLSFQLCLDCHTNPKVLRKFGDQLGAAAEFVDSYHGLGLKLDSPRAAACVSCHDSHKILPKRDPASTVAPANVTATCGECHPGATPEFAASYTHATANLEENRIAGFVQTAYILMIIGVIGGMVVHNLLILLYYVRAKHRYESQKPHLTRFNGQEIWQHILLTITFLGLVVTGFALKFSDSFVFEWLVALGMNETVRSVLHRVFAVGLLATGVWHLAYLGFNSTGRTQLRALWFAWEDIRLTVINLKYHLGLTKERPLFRRYDYSEKAEYWALVWGTAVMAVTGFVLWFPVEFTRVFPFWIVKVSEIIHYYEAILATLAILVWHFFFVILHPEEYPMNLSWLTGKITVELAEEKYPVWAHQEIKRAQNEQE